MTSGDARFQSPAGPASDRLCSERMSSPRYSISVTLHSIVLILSFYTNIDATQRRIIVKMSQNKQG